MTYEFETTETLCKTPRMKQNFYAKTDCEHFFLFLFSFTSIWSHCW